MTRDSSCVPISECSWVGIENLQNTLSSSLVAAVSRFLIWNIECLNQLSEAVRDYWDVFTSEE